MISGLNILPFRANWVRPVTLRSSFVTDQSIESTSGSKTRISQRTYGQRELKFSLLLDQDFRRQWDAFREANPPGTIIGIPMWPDAGIVLTANASIGATSLAVASTAGVDWRGEGCLVSFSPSGTPSLLTVEGFEVLSVSGTTVNLTAGLTNAFHAGDEVMPLLRAYQIADYDETALSAEVSQFDLTFLEDLSQLSAVAVQPSAPTYPEYLSVPVLPLVAEWSKQPRVTITKGTHVVATGLNAQAFATVMVQSRQGIKHSVGMDGRTDRALLWQFFHDRLGRYDRFWLPSLKDELKLSANVSSTDTTLALTNFSQISSRFSAFQNGRSAIFLTDGFNFWCRQVLNLSGGPSRVTIDAALGGSGTVLYPGFCSIGFLTLVQFTTDDLVIDCEAPIVARAELNFTELEREYSEVLTTGTEQGTLVGQELVG